MLAKRFTLLMALGVAAALCANAMPAGAQDAIKRLNIKPTKPAFKKWSEPVVIRTEEDAAKHFGKAPEGVDFKKQIVLLFAWRGSGGDKLEYSVLESFPEQIPFSLKPGATDDLKEHVHVFALRSNVRWSIKGAKAAVEPKKAAKPQEVRPLKFTPKDPTIGFTIGGKNMVTPLADADAVIKLVGKEAAAGLTDAVNFETHRIVLVSWQTSGPPDGALTYEFKGEGKDRALIFYVKAPNVAARGERLRLGADFFAVPRDVAVKYDPKER
ncbi:MAG: hypothetical protein HY289_01445 [Planctomycetes bacterium]|nr:hypothetical protein [Planctomycetota bacterium]